MSYTITQGTQSNYVVTITTTSEQLASHKEAALKQFQKDANVEGFRPGHAPLKLVEERVSAEHLKVAMYEELLHATTSVLIQEHQDKRFIGQMYDLRIDDAKENEVKITFSIDVYPELTEKDTKWTKQTIAPLNIEATDEEIAETMYNLRKQYAEYTEATEVSKQSVFKVSLSFVDTSGTEVHTGKLYLGKEDLEEFPELVTYFLGKKLNDVIALPYDKSTLPPTMHTNKADIKAANINATITEIKDMHLPEFTPETIKKFFGSDDVKTEAELTTKIKGLIETQKEESLLMQAVDGFLQEVMKSFELQIPKTLVDEEMKTRMNSLKERLGGDDGVKKYFEQIGEEEVKKLYTSISDAAKSSLEKFLLLKEVVEKLDIKDIKWDAHLDVEKKLYEKLRK